jgi:hypothetical protein
MTASYLIARTKIFITVLVLQNFKGALEAYLSRPHPPFHFPKEIRIATTLKARSRDLAFVLFL